MCTRLTVFSCWAQWSCQAYSFAHERGSEAGKGDPSGVMLAAQQAFPRRVLKRITPRASGGANRTYLAFRRSYAAGPLFMIQRMERKEPHE